LDIPVDPDGAEPEYETILELIQAYPHLTAHRKKNSVRFRTRDKKIRPTIFDRKRDVAG
jgi:hypothetical protein